ncbi:Alpha-ribazole phosphatase [Candidatus Hydrogenisulfobacillus filiaventi]|uniref:Alpha-ribazole phosphatase n=1 Tax=Candidatus Hydrogenisulfobacillus filiaventi TaxID=2707344 RepID=A0A6F8ZFG8_9FIRM|nr:Alpha-ribazole phosphatase [Candidatus Hydrogenisulfobacillus filiaventi]
MYLLRHAETEWNLRRVVQGARDIPLSEAGRRRAEAAGRALAAIRFDRVLSSDLSRTRETAQRVAGAAAPVEAVTALREQHFGRWEGRPLEELLETEAFRRYSRDPLHTRPPGGESFAEVILRVGLWWDRDPRLQPDTSSRHLLIVGHGGSLRALVFHLLPAMRPLRAATAWANLGLTRLRYEPGRIQLLEWNRPLVEE